jgi:hypothetical protein
LVSFQFSFLRDRFSIECAWDSLFEQQLDLRIREGRAARMAARRARAHYRLSRREYQNTVYDLPGVRYDRAKPGELNADPRWQGFDRIGSQLSL